MRARVQNDRGRPRRNPQSHRPSARRIARSPERCPDGPHARLVETPEDPALYGEIERLAAISGGYGRYADVLEERAAAIFDAAVAQDLWRRLGTWPRASSKDDRRAISAYVKASEQAGDDAEILAALDRLYERTKDLPRARRHHRAQGRPPQRCRAAGRAVLPSGQAADSAIRRALARARDTEASPRARPRSRRPAKLSKSSPSDATLFEEAAEALEVVYRAQNDNERLTALDEKRIAFASSPRERTRIRLDLAKLLEERAADPKRAQAVLEDALADDPTETDVLNEIERLAPGNDGWSSATSRLLTAVVNATDLTPDAARDAYVRLASWYEDKLEESAPRPKSALEKALAEDPENVEICAPSSASVVPRAANAIW